jgi:hypothetical protein
MTPADLLRAVGEALYGQRWVSDMAASTGYGERMIRFWAAGEREPPESINAKAGYKNNRENLCGGELGNA